MSVREYDFRHLPFPDAIDAAFAIVRAEIAETDDTSPEVPVTDLPDDVPNGDIGATEPEEPQ